MRMVHEWQMRVGEIRGVNQKPFILFHIAQKKKMVNIKWYIEIGVLI